MIRIYRKSQLKGLATLLEVRKDWHEPDEQDLTVEVRGSTFDNAGFWPDSTSATMEVHVVIKQHDKPIAAINLATLLAWATGLED